LWYIRVALWEFLRVVVFMEYGIILVVKYWELEKFKEFLALLVVYVLDYNM